MTKPDFGNPVLPSSEEPYIQREIDADKTGTIRRYLRLADELLKAEDNADTSAA